MTLSDIDTFIDHWHDAACGTVSSDEEATELVRFKTTLKRVIRNNRSIRALATSPLLCALLCALNRDRKTQLPKDRMELYRIALEMLLERRDLEREVQTDDIPPPTLAEKQLLLQDFAYWLLCNNYSDAEKGAAEQCIARKLTSMHHVKSSAKDVFNFLLVRSGLLREPMEGRIDFLHRTFQEYLGAKEAVEKNDIGVLTEKAHLDQWREVVILAAGHAQKHQRETLIGGLLGRGDKEYGNRHRLHLLAIACLETSPELSPELTSELRARLRSLIPPKNKTEARALASAGELAIPLLAGHKLQYVGVVSACIRTLALIGGEKAIETLRQYGKDNRVTVFRELVRAWTNFDAETFAREVLAESPLDQGQLEIGDKALLVGVPHLKNLKYLDCNFTGKLDDLTPLFGVERLRRLNIGYCNKISDFTPLAQFDTLESLILSGCSGLNDLSPLAELLKLKTLHLGDCDSLSDLTPLRGLEHLAVLNISRCNKISNLTPLKGLKQLRRLFLYECNNVTDLNPISQLGHLEFLTLYGCRKISDLSPVGQLKALKRLHIGESSTLTDIGPLAGTSKMVHLSIVACAQVTDLRPLAAMKKLNSLYLHGCSGVTDLTPLSELLNLKAPLKIHFSRSKSVITQ